jgi:transposase
MGRRLKYSREFMAMAVQLSREPGATYRSVGEDVGVSRETIRQWALRLAAEESPAERRAREEHAELVALRRRVRVLEEEREILAKAAAFRARETRRRR